MRIIFKLALSLALIAAPVAACAQAQPTPVEDNGGGALNLAPVKIELEASQGRKVPATLWEAPDARGVIVFGHGHGGTPEAYRRLIQRWVESGFIVVGATHLDSLAHPDRASYTPQTGFMTRLEDVNLLVAEAGRRFPGKPVVAAGHSYGSYFAAILGGAATPFGPRSNPAVKAVVALSSPGAIEGLITPDTYKELATPTLMVTGDKDLVPGFVTDWTAHRLPFDTSPEGGKYLMLFEGGDHALARTLEGERFDAMADATVDFMQAMALRDRGAWERLNNARLPEGVTLEKR